MSDYYPKEAIKFMVEQLKTVERDEQCAADGEKVGGNVVKHAEYKGAALGVRIAIDFFNAGLALLDASRPKQTDLMSKQYMQEAVIAISAKLPDNHGFLLLVAPFGENHGRTHYVSTIEHADALNLLKEFLIKAGAAEDWMKHIK